jgi:hypothetical protein
MWIVIFINAVRVCVRKYHVARVGQLLRMMRYRCTVEQKLEETSLMYVSLMLLFAKIEGLN